jgi:hypothetical protein
MEKVIQMQICLCCINIKSETWYIFKSIYKLKIFYSYITDKALWVGKNLHNAKSTRLLLYKNHVYIRKIIQKKNSNIYYYYLIHIINKHNLYIIINNNYKYI